MESGSITAPVSPVSDFGAVDAEVEALDAAYQRWLDRTAGGNADIVVAGLTEQIALRRPDGAACARLAEGPIALVGRDHVARVGGVANVYKLGGQAVKEYLDAAADGADISFEGLLEAIDVAFKPDTTESDEPEPSLDLEPEPDMETKRKAVSRPKRPKLSEEEAQRIRKAGLEKGNRIRLGRVAIMRQLAGMEKTIADLLDEEVISGMSVFDALECLPARNKPKQHRHKAPALADKILQEAEIEPTATFGELTGNEQRRLLRQLSVRGF